jgi:integrase
VGKDENGKQKRKAFYGKTRKEVQDKLTAALNDLNNDAFIEPSKMTVATWVDTWLREYKKNSLKPSTFIGYHNICKVHIKTYLGHHPLKDLQHIHVQQFVNSMADREINRGTIDNMLKVLSGALKQAMKNGFIRKNVATDILLPKKNIKERRVLTPEEQTRFIEAAKTIQHCEVYILAIATGLRLGELLAITWDDIDFEESELNVNKTLYSLKDLENPTAIRKFCIGTPKTRASTRIMPLLPAISEMLKQLKGRQDSEDPKFKLPCYGIARQSQPINNLVFHTLEGKPLTHEYVRRHYYRLLQAANIDKTGLTIHSLRHTFATRGLENGIELRVMQELLGHSNIQMTANLYTHVLPNKKKSSILKLADTIII